MLARCTLKVAHTMIATAKLHSAVSVRKGNAELCNNSPFASEGLHCFQVSPSSPGSVHSTDFLFVGGNDVERMAGAYLPAATKVYVHRVLPEDYIVRSGAWINRVKEVGGGSTSAARLHISNDGTRFLRKPSRQHKLIMTKTYRFIVAVWGALSRLLSGHPLTAAIWIVLVWKLNSYNMVLSFFPLLQIPVLLVHSVIHKFLAKQMKFLDNAVPASVPVSRQSLISPFLMEEMFGTASLFGLMFSVLYLHANIGSLPSLDHCLNMCLGLK